MTNALMVWGIILLVGLALTHYAGASEFYAWVAWLIIFIIGHAFLGTQMKGMPKELNHTWMAVLTLGIVVTVISLAGLIEFNGAWLMGVWLLLYGAGTFAGGIFQRIPAQITVGLVWVVFGLWIPAAFTTTYFLLGGIILGVPMIMQNLKGGNRRRR